MRGILSKFLNINKLLRNTRYLHTTTAKASYEGPGKTIVTMHNAHDQLLIKNCLPHGFELTTGARIYGPMIIMPQGLLAWHVTSWDQITEESLALFKVLTPQLDLLIIGVEKKCDVHMFQTLRERARRVNLTVEITHTLTAAGIYNFMLVERRYIAAALIPFVGDTRTIGERIEAEASTRWLRSRFPKNDENGLTADKKDSTPKLETTKSEKKGNTD